MDNINALNIIFENGDSCIIDKNDCKDFCITNVDDEGNEIEYNKTIISNISYANFFLIKLEKMNNNIEINNRIKKKNDIVQVQLLFKNNKIATFDLASNAEPFDNYYCNNKQYYYENEKYFGCILSEYNIKYLKNIFI